ncbi:phage minor capsid protein [Hominifimenecus microfluidus]|uniref:phage minor capsid protein n=1 Tax=Hominifimenecus microfluidus TaxID=2885348 RepID=UPI0032C00AAA
MAIRTACKRAKLQGEGQMRQEWGVSTVIMNKRGNPCPKCLPWVGKVLIDDVWSGGSRKDGPYPLMSTAIAAGLYHPRCKDGHTTYFEGISTPPDSKFTRKELKQIEKDNRKEAQKQYAERQRGKFGRLADYSLDPENKRRYTARKNVWEQEKAVEKRGGNAIMTYKGIPKTWKRLKGTADDLDLKKVNPNYRWSSNDEYSKNCYNCVVAYEMRMRKYDVTAQPERKNKYLSRHPEAAWVEPDVKTIHTGEDPYQKIKDAFEEWPDGARAEIAIIWRERGFGHVFVAEKENNQLRFLDPQRNEEYTADVFEQTENEKTRFWRIDDRDVSDRGVTACKEE